MDTVSTGNPGPVAGYVCEHDRLADSCEDCSYVQAAERGLPLGGPPPAETRAKQQGRPLGAPKVDEDTLVTADDGRDVLVVAGDVVPTELAGRPSRPRGAVPAGKHA